MSTYDAHLRTFDLVAPAVLAVFSIILAGTAIKTATVTSGSGYSRIEAITRAAGLLSFDGLFTFLWASAAVAAAALTLSEGPLGLVFSPLAKLVTVAVLWILWLSGAAALTDSVNNVIVGSCDGDSDCNTLRAAEAFAWLGWILLTVMLAAAIFVFIKGGSFGRSGGVSSAPKTSSGGGFTSGTVGGAAATESGLEMGQAHQAHQPVSAAPAAPAATYEQTAPAPQQPYPTYDANAAAPQHHEQSQQQFAIGSPVEGAASGPAPSFPEPQPSHPTA